ADVDERADPSLEVRRGIGREPLPWRNASEDRAGRRDRTPQAPEAELRLNHLDLWVQDDARGCRQDEVPFAGPCAERSGGVPRHRERLLAVDVLARVERSGG